MLAPWAPNRRTATTCACSTRASTPAATGRSASRATWCSIRAIRACATVYPHALGWGFRRSGDIVYRPHCAGCRACVAVRIPVDRLRARPQPAPLPRAQCATSKCGCCRRSAPTSSSRSTAATSRARHARRRHGRTRRGGVRPVPDRQLERGPFPRTSRARARPGSCSRSPSPTAPTQRCRRSTRSTTRTKRGRGLGTLAILRQIEWARRERRRHLYLGYWIDGHPKMDYKRRFRPLEAVRRPPMARLP